MRSLNDEKKSRLFRRIERIKKEVPLSEVLLKYSYGPYISQDRLSQFRCDLHSDGYDQKPSARFYPDSNTTYCFGCGAIRDAVDYVSIKEGISLSKACKILEKAYGLPMMPFENEEEEQEEIVEDHFEEIEHRVFTTLQTIFSEKSLDEKLSFKLLELYFRFKETRSSSGMEKVLVRSNKFLRDKNTLGSA